MTSFAAIDITALPPPLVVETLSYEVILASLLQDFRDRDPAYSAIVESDPAYKILEVCAYRELILRARVNDAARALLLAFATGPDLDHLGASPPLRLTRLVLRPADPTTVPPTPAVLESDDDFRRRLQLSPEGYTTAGSEGAYVFHALGADPRVKDASAYSPADGRVELRILARAGTAPDELLAVVEGYVSAAERRPLTDKLGVLSADVQGYRVMAVLTCYPGPDPALVLAAAEAGVAAYAARTARLGYDVTRSGLFAALHVAGVQNVELVEPAENVVCDITQAPALLGTDIRLAEVTDV